MRGLGAGIVIALAGAIAAASVRGSGLRAGGVETSDAWAILFLAATVAAFALYVCALALLRRHGGAVRTTLLFAVAIQTVALAGPVLLSRDVYSYEAYGRVVSVHDANPYSVSPSRFPHDPATMAVAPAWRSTTSVYGPGFTAASASVTSATGSSNELDSLVFRICAALAVIACAVLAARLARRAAFAAAFIGWNPLLAIHFAGAGHNDAWMIAALLAALLLLERRSDVAGGAAWMVAASIKLPALLLLPLKLPHMRRSAWIGLALAAAGIGVAASIAFGTSWLEVLHPLQARESSFSIPSRLAGLGLGHSAALVIARVALAAGAAVLLFQTWAGRPRLGLGAGLLLLTSPWLLPWYAIWPVGLAAVEDDVTAQVLAVVIAAYLLPDRVPF